MSHFSPVRPLIGLLLCGVVLISCNGKDSPPPESPAGAQASSAAQTIERTETQRMHAFMDEVYERNVDAWPEWETQLGRKTDRREILGGA